MVELQIVILAVAGSSPVGHPTKKSQVPNPRLQNTEWNLGFEIGVPPSGGVARAVLKKSACSFRRALSNQRRPNFSATDFWLRLLQDEELRDCDNLQKLLVGCEIIAALDGVDLLAA